MAKANLVVDDSLKAAFHDAIEASDVAKQVAYFILQVDPTSATISLEKAVPHSDAPALEASFKRILEHELGDKTGARLFAVAQNAHGSSWTMVSFVPDTVHPKRKMLYAAARDDVKRAVEPSRFTADYHVTDVDSLAFSEYSTWRDRSDRHAAMSESEKVKARVVAETNATRAALVASGTKLGGMVAVPFHVADEALAAIKQLAPAASPAHSAPEAAPAEEPAEPLAAVGGSGDAGASSSPASTHSPATASAGPTLTFVELAASGDRVSLVSTTPDALTPKAAVERMKVAVTTPAPTAGHARSGSGFASPTASPLSPGVAKAEPRFFLLRLGKAAVPALIYYCPATTAPRARIASSTAKAPLVDAIGAAGVRLGLVIEASDEDDLAAAAARVASGETAGASGGGGALADASASSSASGAGTMHSPIRGVPAGLVALPGMAIAGGPHLRSPSTPSSAGASASAAAGSEGDAEGSPGSFDKPARPGRGGARMMGVALPGMSPRS